MLTRLAALRARKCGTKVIYTAHGFHFFKGAPLINWLLYFPVEWFLARYGGFSLDDEAIHCEGKEYTICNCGLRVPVTVRNCPRCGRRF